MADRFVVGVTLGRWQTNCYVVGDHGRGSCVVIDPGEDGAREVPALLDRLGVTCEAVLLTHGHLDHFWAAPDLAKRLDVPVHLHPGDRWLWDNPAAGFGMPAAASDELMRSQFGLVWDPDPSRLREVQDHDHLTLAGIDFVVRHNPGHTPGHVTFLGRDLAGADLAFAMASGDHVGSDVLFSGDLIFAGSVGRTDFPRGSTEDLLQSLVDTVLPLEDDTLILSGHGPDTSVGRERATNPYVAEARRLLT
jgi:hydroxyacylglutathione hydrolase